MNVFSRVGGPVETVRVLSVSPLPEDHLALERIFAGNEENAGITTNWQVSATATLSLAMRVLRNDAYPVVLCECNLPRGDWKDLLRHTSRLPDPPLVVVTSRLADDYLWTEALHLGAHDVLAKPYNPEEVIRVVGLACQRWYRERPHIVPKPCSRQAAAGRPPAVMQSMKATGS